MIPTYDIQVMPPHDVFGTLERRGKIIAIMNSIFLNGLSALLTPYHKAVIRLTHKYSGDEIRITKALRGYLYYIRHKDKIYKRRKCHLRRK